jgi:aminoglycoside 3-N-acetyltransferase
MPEIDTIHPDQLPQTVESLAHDLAACGLAAGQTVLVHTAMSKIGWIAGGPQTVIEAFLRVLGAEGTLMMPAHSTDNTDPANWQNPPVPEHWWPIIRASQPAYDPTRTHTRNMGAVAELFRTWPGVLRGVHPTTSFATYGPNAPFLINSHTQLEEFNEESPVGRLYALDGYVYLIGVDHGNNTSLHHAEFLAHWPGKRWVQSGSAMLVDGVRQWVNYERLDVDWSDFPAIGDSYEAEHNIPRGRVGLAEVRFMKQRPLIDYAVKWMEAHRT